MDRTPYAEIAIVIIWATVFLAALVWKREPGMAWLSGLVLVLNLLILVRELRRRA